MDILGLVFPKKCINCGKGENYMCEVCLGKVRVVEPICAYCQKPGIDGMTHASCLKKSRMDGFISFWDYAGVVRRAILGLKYKFAREISKELAVLMVKNIKQKYSFLGSSWILIPIPIYHLRENWRGFNQSSLIGEQIAKNLGWKFVPNLLLRKKVTKSQTELKGKERVENIKRAFGLSPRFKLNGGSFILFDDVFTTGSTLKEAAKVLKRGGAGKVWGLTIAR